MKILSLIVILLCVFCQNVWSQAASEPKKKIKTEKSSATKGNQVLPTTPGLQEPKATPSNAIMENSRQEEGSQEKEVILENLEPVNVSKSEAAPALMDAPVVAPVIQSETKSTVMPRQNKPVAPQNQVRTKLHAEPQKIWEADLTAKQPDAVQIQLFRKQTDRKAADFLDWVNCQINPAYEEAYHDLCLKQVMRLAVQKHQEEIRKQQLQLGKQIQNGAKVISLQPVSEMQSFGSQFLQTYLLEMSSPPNWELQFQVEKQTKTFEKQTESVWNARLKSLQPVK